MVSGVIKRCLGLLGLYAVLGLSSAGATVLNDAGILCQGGELTVTTGVAYRAHCTGDLLIGLTSFIRAEKSIQLSAIGNAAVFGRLTAPYIVIIAGNAVNVGEGAELSIQGSRLPWTVLSPAGGSVSIASRTSAGLDPRIVVGSVMQLPNSPSVVFPQVFAVSVPEPGTLLLIVAGSLAMIGLSRRSQA